MLEQEVKLLLMLIKERINKKNEKNHLSFQFRTKFRIFGKIIKNFGEIQYCFYGLYIYYLVY